MAIPTNWPLVQHFNPSTPLCSSQWCCWSYKNQLEFKLPLISSIETHFLQMNIQIKPIESPSLHFFQLNTFQQKKLHFLQTIFILSNWRPCRTHQMKEIILQLISIYLSSTLWPNSSYTGQQGTNTACFILFDLSNLLNGRNKRRHRWATWIPFSCFSWKRNFWKGNLFSWWNRACSFLSTEGWPNRPNEGSRLKATLTRDFLFFINSIQLKKFSFVSNFI